MKNLLNKMLIPQDKANHFVWTVVILTVVMGLVTVADTVLNTGINFFILVGFSFAVTAVIGLVKEIRDYATGKGTLSFLDMLANVSGLIAAFILIELAMIAYR